MKHSYQADCECARCTRERERRTTQAASDPRRFQQKPKRRRVSSRRATPGSLEWAEARGGLIGGYEED